MSYDSYSVFKLTADTQLAPSAIINELNQLRGVVSQAFYANLSKKNKVRFQRFLWDTLHGLWLHSAPQVKLYSAGTLGLVLVKLAPFFADELITSLREVIGAMTEESFLLLACFCYLSKFMSVVSLSTILSETPIIHLFGGNANEHMPLLVKELLHLPKDFLVTLAEFFVNMAISNPSNRHLPRAAAVIIETDPDEYVDVIKDKTPLSIIAALFPENLPKLSATVLENLKTKAYDCLKSETPALTEYEAACVVLSLLLKSHQVSADEVSAQITEKMFKSSPNLNTLMMLPVNELFVKELYTFETDEVDVEDYKEEATAQPAGLEWTEEQVVTNETIGSYIGWSIEVKPIKTKVRHSKLTTEKAYILPLMTYFSRNMQYQHELTSLLTHHMKPKGDYLSNVIATLGEVADSIDPELLNEMLLNLLSLKSNNWVTKLWLLKMLVKMNFRLFTKVVSEKAFELIEACVIDKSEALRDYVKEVGVAVFEHCRVETFKLFIDKVIRKMDVFDRTVFEYRLSFLAHIFQATPPNWSLSFLHLASLMIEAITLFAFSSKVMMDMFSIVGVMANHLRDPSSILHFVKLALTIVEASYHEFVGEPLGLSRPQLFSSDTNIAALPFQLVKIDSDLTSNPSASHTVVLQGAKTAVDLLMRLQWRDFELSNDEVNYLFHLSCKLVYLFPAQINQLVANLVDLGQLTATSALDTFVHNTLKVSKAKDGLLYGARLLLLCMDKFSDWKLNSFASDEFVHSLEMVFPKCSSLDFSIVVTVQKFLERVGIVVPDETCVKVVKQYQRHAFLDRKKHEGGDVGPEDEKEEAIAEASDLYPEGMSQLDSSSSLFEVCEQDQSGPSILEPDSLLHTVQSLTPFYFLEVPVPDELYVSPLVISFCSYSSYHLNQEQAEILLERAISKCNVKSVFHVLRTCVKNKIQLDLMPYLGHRAMRSKSVFSPAFQMMTKKYKRMDSLPEQILDYAKAFTGPDITSFILNASGKIARSIATVLLRFDPSYFVQCFLKAQRDWRSFQILNLIHYTLSVKFPPEDYFRFIVSVVSATITSRKKRNIARRLLTVFVHKNIHSEEITKHAVSLLGCDVGLVSSIDSLQKQNDAYVVEWYYEMLVLADVADCKKIASFLKDVLPKTTIYGQTMSLMFSPVTVESITSMLNSGVSSIRLLPFTYYGRKTSPDPTFTPQMLELFMQQKLTPTSFTQFTISQFAKRFSSLYLNSDKFTEKQKKAFYTYLMSNVDSDINSGTLPYVLQEQLHYLALFPVESPEFKAISDKTQSLFTTSVVLRDAWELLCQCCSKEKEPLHAKQVFDPYLRRFNSYQSHLVAERAAKYTLGFSEAETNVNEIIPECRSFYATFYAIVSIERICPEMNHDTMMNLYSAVYNKALSLLNDPMMRVFAPIFALANGEHGIPKQLQVYLDETREKLLNQKST